MVITLCGSTKFKKIFEEMNKDLTLKGHVVLSVGCFIHSGDNVTEEQKQMLDDIHKKKIDLSEAIYVINPDGYVGKSTMNEILYAGRTGKKIYYYVNELGERDL